MPLLELTDEEINLILDHVANTMSWAKANQLLIKISQQVQAQQMKRHTVNARVGADGSLQPIEPDGGGKPDGGVQGAEIVGRS